MVNNTRINYKSLPQECKIFLDAIDVIERTDATTVEEIVQDIESDQNTLKYFIDNEVSKSYTQEAINGLLENYNRLINVKEFIKNHFENK